MLLLTFLAARVFGGAVAFIKIRLISNCINNYAGRILNIVFILKEKRSPTFNLVSPTPFKLVSTILILHWDQLLLTSMGTVNGQTT